MSLKKGGEGGEGAPEQAEQGEASQGSFDPASQSSATSSFDSILEELARPVVPARAAAWEPGTLIDRYRVIRFLGRGGMGEVYLARDTKLGRKVALKVIRRDAMGSSEAVDRFLFEARTTARFSHPHIVTIHDVGEHEGNPYVALEYLGGQTLRQRLDEERLGLRAALRIALAIARALEEAHRHQILHRDLKPDNVLIPREGRVRVVDFGLAKRVETLAPAAESASLTAARDLSLALPAFESASGALRGTPAYMAPEQWKEEPATPATDIWALGVILYELLTGRRPYDARSSHLLAIRVASPEPVPPVSTHAEVPAELAALIGACLDKDPTGRPPAREVAERLEGLLRPGLERASESRPPFRGLLPFAERHADLFFGRDAEVGAFLERLREQPVVPVVGPSGSGKSSFVAAGVIPRLREHGRWEVLALRPARSPFAALAARLLPSGSPGSRPATPASEERRSQAFRSEEVPAEPHAGAVSGIAPDVQALAAALREAPRQLGLRLLELAQREEAQVLLFVDQLEELCTLVEDEGIRRAFMTALAAAADDPALPVRVVLTLRDDYLGRLAFGPEVRDVLGQVVVLQNPEVEALADILVKPIEAVGYRYEDERLVPEMIAAVASEPARLPLLQFAGAMLWDRRDRAARMLSRSSYESMGGVGGALARHADSLISGLPAGEERIARALFLRLVTEEGTRRVVDRAELLEGLDGSAERVLDRLVQGRLVTALRRPEPALELVHESLLERWGLLRRWREESQEEFRFLEEVGQGAALWERRGQPDSEVWGGDALRAAGSHALHPARAGAGEALPHRWRGQGETAPAAPALAPGLDARGPGVWRERAPRAGAAGRRPATARRRPTGGGGLGLSARLPRDRGLDPISGSLVESRKGLLALEEASRFLGDRTRRLFA